MKFTRRQLVKLVKEEMAHPRDHLGKNIADVEFPVVVGYEDKSEIAYNQDELDNILDDITPGPRGKADIPYSLNSLKDVEAEDMPVGAAIEQMENFKISKSSLKEMIKNSVRATILEQVVGYEAPSGSEESEQDDYLTTGQTSIAAAPHSQEEEQAADTSTRELTQQRQQQLDTDDAGTADDTGRQLKDLLKQKNEGKMRVTKRQLRKIIHEALLNEQAGDGNWKPEYQGYHPLFAGNYAGNGYTTRMWEPARAFFEANADNEHFALALEIMDGKNNRPPYLPFGFASAVMKQITKVGGLSPEIIQELDMDMMSTDNEYMVAYTDW